MKIPSIIKKVINMYIKEKGLNKKDFNEKLMTIYVKILREMNEYCDCGGTENSMAKVNLCLSAGVFALYDASHRTLTVQDILKYFDQVVPKSIPIISVFVKNHMLLLSRILIGHYIKLEKLIEQHKAKGEWKDSWSIEIKSVNSMNESISFDLIGCPIVKYAKKYGYMEIMPAICGSDYITIRQLGLKLIRPQIVADGYERCLYTYLPDRNQKK